MPEQRTRSIVKPENGQSVIEYALVIALVSIVIVALLTGVASGAMTNLTARIVSAVA